MLLEKGKCTSDKPCHKGIYTELIYWLTTLTHLCILSASSYYCLKSFINLEELTTHIITIKKAEHYLKRCGQFLALRRNIIDSYHILRLIKKRDQQLKQAYRSLLAQLTPYLEKSPCTTKTLPNLSSIAYREMNPSLPLFWPNWNVRFKKQDVF